MKTAVATAPSRSRAATVSLIILVVVNIVNFYDRHVGGALAEPMRKEFGLNDTQLGLISTAFTILYAIIGLPLGWLADKGSRKKLLAAGVVVWGTLTGLAAWATTLSMLIFTRLGLGVGEASCAPAATSWIGDLFPPERRAKPLALFMLGVPVGGALSFFFSGSIAQHFGWRRAMIAAAVPALLLAPVLLLLKEPERGAAEKTAAAAHGSIWDVLRIPTFRWIILSGILVNFNLYAIGTFFPAFLQRVHHLRVDRAGLATGVIYIVGGLLGGTLGGFWGDSIVRQRPNGRLAIAAVASLVAVPLCYFGIHQPLGNIAWAVPLLALGYGALNMYYGLVYSSVQDIVAPALRGTSMAIYFLVMYLGGASFGPYAIGKLSDSLARHAALASGSSTVTEAFKATGLQQALFVIPIFSLGLALVLWAGSRTIARDMERRA